MWLNSNVKEAVKGELVSFLNKGGKQNKIGRNKCKFMRQAQKEFEKLQATVGVGEGKGNFPSMIFFLFTYLKI